MSKSNRILIIVSPFENFILDNSIRLVIVKGQDFVFSITGSARV